MGKEAIKEVSLVLLEGAPTFEFYRPKKVKTLGEAMARAQAEGKQFAGKDAMEYVLTLAFKKNLSETEKAYMEQFKNGHFHYFMGEDAASKGVYRTDDDSIELMTSWNYIGWSSGSRGEPSSFFTHAHMVKQPWDTTSSILVLA